MLAIRLQRTGRKGHPMYRMIVQEARRQPTSGNVVAQLGSYNPHTKEISLKKDLAELYLKNGAQPSERVVKILEAEKVSLPKWVEKSDVKRQKAIKNLEKLRRNRPAEEIVEEQTEAVDAEAAAEVTPTEEAEAPVEQTATETAEDAQVEVSAETEEPKNDETTPEEVKPETEAESKEEPEDSPKADKKEAKK